MLTDDNWFRDAIAAMFAGLGWFLGAELMFRYGQGRISPDLYVSGPDPLTRLWTLQLLVYAMSAAIAAIVFVRLFVVFARMPSVASLLPGIALAGSLRLLVSMDTELSPYPLWFELSRFLLVTLPPLALVAWMTRRSRG